MTAGLPAPFLKREGPQDVKSGGKGNVAKKFVLFLLHGYRKYLSPLKGAPSCRFYPTCSQYAVDAVTKYGALKGSWMAFRRILRCHPYHPGGYDPVP